jgi:hypothetical protein
LGRNDLTGKEMWDKLNHRDVLHRAGVYSQDLISWYDLFYWTEFTEAEKDYLTGVMMEMMESD